MDGIIQIVGIGGGVLPTGFFSTPFGAAVRAPVRSVLGQQVGAGGVDRAGEIEAEEQAVARRLEASLTFVVSPRGKWFH